MGTQFIKKLPRIFCNTDALNELIQMAQTSMSEEDKKHYDDVACALEIIDLPYTMVWTPATNDTAEILSEVGYPEDRGSNALMLMFHRFEDGTNVEEVQAMVVAVDDNGSRGISTMCKDRGLGSNVNAFYIAANGINRFLQDENLYEKYINLDSIKDGMMLDLVDGRMVAEIVCGKDRPDMECFINKGMFSIDCKTRRPYKDEENIYNDEVDDEEIEEANTDFQGSGGTLVRYNGHDTSVVIPDGILQIGDGASMTFFQSGVINVSVPECVKSIGGYAFYNCTTLENINIPTGVTEIGHHAFRQCSKLKSVVIPDGVEVIERESFWGCVGLEEIQLPAQLKVIEEKAFSGCVSVATIDIPDGVEVIEDGAFWGDGCLTKVTIPASVSSIGEMAFSDCNNLKIYGHKGSYAEEYATENDIPFVAI